MPWHYEFSRVVEAVGGDAVDARQGAVEDDVGLTHGDFQRVGQVRCQCDQEFDRLVDVAADGGQAEAELRSERGVGVAAPVPLEKPSSQVTRPCQRPGSPRKTGAFAVRA
ncbi:hypothetical protein GCM10009634_80040 [Saccharothrix xinjiangensis]